MMSERSEMFWKMQLGMLFILRKQREFSDKTFGPGRREKGLIKHIKKELVEIEEAKTTEDKLMEWIDVIILALDGAWRCAEYADDFDPLPQTFDTMPAVASTFTMKCRINSERVWPHWMDCDPSEPIEHIKETEE